MPLSCATDYQGGSGDDDSGGSGGESDDDSTSGAESVQEDLTEYTGGKSKKKGKKAEKEDKEDGGERCVQGKADGLVEVALSLLVMYKRCCG